MSCPIVNCSFLDIYETNLFPVIDYIHLSLTCCVISFFSCCGAGTAADTEMTTRKIESQLELLRLNMGREVPVCVANRMLQQTLFRYQV